MNKKGALEGLGMLKAILISIVLFGGVLGIIFAVQQDLGSQPLVNKQPNADFNKTYSKTQTINSLNKNMTEVLIGQRTSDTNTVSLLISGGFSVIKTIFGYLTLPFVILQDLILLLGIPDIIAGIITAIISIIIIFIIIKIAFGASGGSL